MSYIGKIFVFAVFIMSLMLMTLAGAIYMSHVNWKDEVHRKPEEVRPGQQKGYVYQIKDAREERDKLTKQIDELQRKVAESEQSRDQVIAKLQTAIVEKNEELSKLRDEEEALRKRATEANAEVKRLTDDLANADRQVADLAEQVRQQQVKVDSQVEKSAELSADLAQTQAQLTMAAAGCWSRTASRSTACPATRCRSSRGTSWRWPRARSRCRSAATTASRWGTRSRSTATVNTSAGPWSAP